MRPRVTSPPPWSYVGAALFASLAAATAVYVVSTFRSAAAPGRFEPTQAGTLVMAEQNAAFLALLGAAVALGAVLSAALRALVRGRVGSPSRRPVLAWMAAGLTAVAGGLGASRWGWHHLTTAAATRALRPGIRACYVVPAGAVPAVIADTPPSPPTSGPREAVCPVGSDVTRVRLGQSPAS